MDVARCLELYEMLNDELPKILGEADAVVRTKERILSNADIVAKNVIHEAEQRAEKIIDSSEISRLAEKQGRELLDRTYKECDRLILKTKEHLDSLFGEAEGFFQSTLSLVKTNRNELRGALVRQKD